MPKVWSTGGPFPFTSTRRTSASPTVRGNPSTHVGLGLVAAARRIRHQTANGGDVGATHNYERNSDTHHGLRNRRSLNNGRPRLNRGGSSGEHTGDGGGVEGVPELEGDEGAGEGVYHCAARRHHRHHHRPGLRRGGVRERRRIGEK